MNKETEKLLIDLLAEMRVTVAGYTIKPEVEKEYCARILGALEGGENGYK